MSSKISAKENYTSDYFTAEHILNDVYGIIRQFFVTDDQNLDEILGRVFSSRGKGTRPYFMDLTAESAGGCWEDVKYAASVIEGIHIASLVHDDVVDNSELRRGEKTLNADFTNKISVLFGDFTFLKALSIAHEKLPSHALTLIYNSVERMVQGEILEAMSDKEMDEKAYIRMISYKTASLFSVSGELGILLSSDDQEKKKLASELGEYIGISFQIIDDTLDFNGNKDVMGKPAMKDAISGQMTLPLIFSIKGMSNSEKNNLLNITDESPQKIRDLVKSKGGIEYSLDIAHSYIKKANNALDGLLDYGNSNNTSIRKKFDNFFSLLLRRNF